MQKCANRCVCRRCRTCPSPPSNSSKSTNPSHVPTPNRSVSSFRALEASYVWSKSGSSACVYNSLDKSSRYPRSGVTGVTAERRNKATNGAKATVAAGATAVAAAARSTAEGTFMIAGTCWWCDETATRLPEVVVLLDKTTPDGAKNESCRSVSNGASTPNHKRKEIFPTERSILR